jgi:hypothetical protein
VVSSELHSNCVALSDDARNKKRKIHRHDTRNHRGPRCQRIEFSESKKSDVEGACGK